MSEHEQERERRDGEAYEVVISDLRHRRDVDDLDEEETAQPPAEPEPAAAALPAAEPAAAPPAAPSLELAAPPAAAPPAAADAPADLLPPEEAGFATDEELAAEQISEGEMAYLRQVFAAGLPNYLRGQLGLLLNFALLSLGRAPDPATGLVAKNLPHARLAIDMLEFIITRLEPDLQAAEKVQMKALLSDLKFAYMQATGAAPPPVAPPAQ